MTPASNRAAVRLLARGPDDDEGGGVHDPKEARTIGSAGEREEVARVRRGLEQLGYDLRTDRQYEVEDDKPYYEIWDSVSKLVDNPYELENE